LVIKKKPNFLIFKPLSAKKLKETTINLGASFIKLAQVLATRADFFSKEYLDELKELHDQLPSMSQKDCNTIFDRAFKENPFSSFDNTAIASASIGQVHVAFLKSGEKVAVKLRRMGIKEQVKADIKIINFLTLFLNPYFHTIQKTLLKL
jgi:ubiquinone biosynthesis protein